MNAKIDTYPDRFEITVELTDDIVHPEGGARLIEHTDQDTDEVVREACWTLSRWHEGDEVDPVAWAQQEIPPLLAASAPASPAASEPGPENTTTVSI